MKTVTRLTAECELMNLHQYEDADGNPRGCAGRCLGNDETTAFGNYAGDQVRIICSCECHKAGPNIQRRATMKCATQQCENTVDNPGDLCDECRTVTIKHWYDPITSPRVNNNKCVADGCGRESNYHLCEKHAVPGMVMGIGRANECYVISLWLVERQGQTLLVTLNDYTLGNLFGSKEAFEKQLLEDGYIVHKFISTYQQLDRAKRLNPGLACSPWTPKTVLSTSSDSGLTA